MLIICREVSLKIIDFLPGIAERGFNVTLELLATCVSPSNCTLRSYESIPHEISNSSFLIILPFAIWDTLAGKCL